MHKIVDRLRSVAAATGVTVPPGLISSLESRSLDSDVKIRRDISRFLSQVKQHLENHEEKATLDTALHSLSAKEKEISQLITEHFEHNKTSPDFHPEEKWRREIRRMENQVSEAVSGLNNICRKLKSESKISQFGESLSIERARINKTLEREWQRVEEEFRDEAKNFEEKIKKTFAESE
ncbi:hypothetical protein [Martelella alba]|uniref:hypothetical protein n=1 Tax=Martelella alba TaxID=2590451 RepID=UPI0014850DC4|nr:hypothetical protein [Martelella alba]